jgi:hypothetical protein
MLRYRELSMLGTQEDFHVSSAATVDLSDQLKANFESLMMQ